MHREHLLPALYGRVLIPPAVADELNHPNAPEVARAWLLARPSWLEIRQPTHALGPAVDLDSGEQEAIALAEEVAADLLLVDEWDARVEAERWHLQVVGTLRVLADGASRGLTNLEEAFERLRHTNFRVNSKLLESLLEVHRRRKTYLVQGYPDRPYVKEHPLRAAFCCALDRHESIA